MTEAKKKYRTPTKNTKTGIASTGAGKYTRKKNRGQAGADAKNGRAIGIGDRQPGARGSKPTEGGINSGAGGSRAFDESKVRRAYGGKFGEKPDEAALGPARRIVAEAVAKLQIGSAVNLPAGLGWVQRTAGGYVVQGEAGNRVAVRNVSEAVEAAAAILATKMKPKTPGGAPAGGTPNKTATKK